MRREMISWDEVHQLIDHLMVQFDEEYDAMVIITRGGIVPGGMLAEAMDVLNDREKDILMQRRLSDETITLEDLSTQYKVSRERIRQIEVRAFEKIQQRMQELASEKGMAVAE